MFFTEHSLYILPFTLCSLHHQWTRQSYNCLFTSQKGSQYFYQLIALDAGWSISPRTSDIPGFIFTLWVRPNLKQHFYIYQYNERHLGRGDKWGSSSRGIVSCQISAFPPLVKRIPARELVPTGGKVNPSFIFFCLNYVK